MSDSNIWLNLGKIVVVLLLIGIMTISLKEIADDVQYLWEEKRWTKFWTLITVLCVAVLISCAIIGNLMAGI